MEPQVITHFTSTFDPHTRPIRQKHTFTQAAELDVTLPRNDKGIVDVFIDDNIPVCPDFGNNAERAATSVPLALHTIGRPRS